MRFILRAAAVSLALAAAACVSAGQPGGVLRNSSEITPEELRATTRRTAYEVVQALRPEWLRKRSRTSGINARGGVAVSDEVMAFRDGQRLGTVETLRSIPVGDVGRIRYYSASGAQQRFGSGNPNGAIEVLTR